MGWTFVLLVLVALASQVETRLLKSDFQTPSEEELLANKSKTGTTERALLYLESDLELAADEVRPVIDFMTEGLKNISGVSSVSTSPEQGQIDYIREKGRARLFLYLETHHLKLLETRLRAEGMRPSFELASQIHERDLNIQRAIRGRDPLGILGIAALALKGDALQSKLRIEDGLLRSVDGKKYFILLETATTTNTVEKTRTLVRGIERLIEDAKTEPNLESVLGKSRLSLVGRPVSYLSAVETFDVDIRRVGTMAALAILLLLLVFSRSFLKPLLMSVPIIFGVSLALSVAYLVYGSISMISLIFVGLVIGLGVDFAIHIYAHLHIRKSDDSGHIVDAFMRPGPAILLAGLTTSLAFSSLWLISYPVMKQIALLSCVGIMGAIIGTFLLLPALLSFTNTRKETGLIQIPFPRFLQGEQKSSRRAFLIWALFLVICLGSIRWVKYEPHPWGLALRGNPKTAELDRLNRDLELSFTPLSLVSKGESIEEAIDNERKAIALIRLGSQRAGVVAIESLSDWLPPAKQQLTNAQFVSNEETGFSKDRFLADYDQLLEEYFGQERQATAEGIGFTSDYREKLSMLFDTDLNPFDLSDLRVNGLDPDRFVEKSSDMYQIRSSIYLNRFPWAEGVIPNFLETFQRAGGDKLENSFFEGSMFEGRAHRAILQRDATRAFSLALILVLLLLFVWMRNWFSVLLCLTPALIGIAAALAFMAVFGIELTMLTMSIAPILIGIGVDDGIHIVQRLRKGEKMRSILSETGSALSFTTFTTVVAFLCMSFATFDGVREMGLVGAFGLIVALLSSLHLLPKLWRLKGKSPRTKNFPETI